MLLLGPLTWDHFQRGTINVFTETGLDPAGPTLSHDFSDFPLLVVSAQPDGCPSKQVSTQQDQL